MQGESLVKFNQIDIQQMSVQDGSDNVNRKLLNMIQVDKGICPHNHVCPLIKACPVGAISQDAEGFPVIDYSLCIECGKCVRKCPMKAMKQVEK